MTPMFAEKGEVPKRGGARDFSAVGLRLAADRLP